MQPIHPKIAVLHHLGAGNFGDEASLAAVVQNIRKRWPDAQFTALTMNPQDTEKVHGIPALPIRSYTWAKGYASSSDDMPEASSGLGNRLANLFQPLVRPAASLFREFQFLLSAYSTIRQFDELVISGGGQLTGRSGPWGFPFGILIWMTLARIAGLRRVILNIGVGPLNSRLVTLFSVQSLKAANYVSFRDEKSRALAETSGYKGSSHVSPDNAYLLDIPVFRKPWAARGVPVVGISPMPYPFCDPWQVPSGHQQIYNDFIGKFAKFASSVADRSFSLELFGTDVGVDAQAIDDLRAALRDNYRIELPAYLPDRTLSELLSRTASVDYVVTCRFHGVIMAHLLNKPVIAIAHHVKVETAMADIGLSEYCFDIASFDPDHLTDAFASLVAHRAEIEQKMKDRLATNRAKLSAQFDELYPVLAGNKRLPESSPVRKAVGKVEPVRSLIA